MVLNNRTKIKAPFKNNAFALDRGSKFIGLEVSNRDKR